MTKKLATLISAILGALGTTGIAFVTSISLAISTAITTIEAFAKPATLEAK